MIRLGKNYIGKGWNFIMGISQRYNLLVKVLYPIESSLSFSEKNKLSSETTASFVLSLHKIKSEFVLLFFISIKSKAVFWKNDKSLKINILYTIN